MGRTYLLIAVLLVTATIAEPSQPFGPNPKLGQTYGGFAEGYLHDAIDIHVGCNDSIFSINDGRVEINPTGNPKAGRNDREKFI